MKRIMLVAMTLVVGIAFVTPRGAAAPMQKGKKNKTTVAVRMTLHNEYPFTQLISDGMIRNDPGIFDEDLDDFGDLIGPFPVMPNIYQDSRITGDDTGGATFPDPCSELDDSRAQLDPQDCSVVNPDYADDARTYSLVFKPLTPNDGADCACTEFASYLINLDGTPALMFSRDPAGETAATRFVDNRIVDGTCTLHIAAGAIVTDRTGDTASQQIVASPYAQPRKPKGKKGGDPGPAMTSVNFNFHTDREVAGASRDYQLISQATNLRIENPDIENPDTPEDTGARIVTGAGERFDLRHPGSAPMCFGIPMVFKISYQSFEVPAQ